MDHGDVRRYVSGLAASWPIGERRWSERDATIVVADVCGFTRLSERLGRLGPEGTEAVKEVINAVFRPCLDIALRAGGDVLTFAGDGFVTMFDGDGHAEVAVRAAAAMQLAVRDLDALRTPAGRVRPRVTVGVETGRVTALLLGGGPDGRLDVVTTGGAVDAAFALDTAATPGQVRVGEHVAARLPSTWSRNVPSGPGRRVHLPAATGIDLDPGVGAASPAGASSRFVDPGVLAVIGRGQSPAEHRTIAAAFVVVRGVPDHPFAAGDHVGPLATISATVAEVCREHGVCWLESDTEHDRVRFLLTAGAPIRRGNDTERLVAAVRAISDRHDVSIGVARGRAFVGDVGHELRRTYNVMGPVVNLAARLAAAAPVGTVLVTGQVTALVDRAYDTEPAGSLRLKGFGDPVPVTRLGARTSTVRRTTSGARLRGRDAELGHIRSLVERLPSHGGAALEIVADAGVGKTRLVDEIVDTADVVDTVGTASLRAVGERDRRATPYAAASPLVRQALGIPIDASADAAGERLTAAVGSAAPHLLDHTPLIASAAHATVPRTDAADAVATHLRASRTRQSVTELLSVAMPGPAILVAEDVHWFDEASRSLLIAIAGVDRPWLVLATRRPDGAPLAGFDTVALGALDQRATRAAVLDAAPESPLSRRQLAEIVAASAGNPLFARELVSAAVAGAATLPDEIEEIIAARIDGLDLSSRLMLRDLAVAGTDVDGSTVDDLLAEHGLGAEALVLMSDFVVVTDTGVRFAHDLYRRVAYEGQSVKRRRELHRRFAAHLAERPDAETHAAAIAEHAFHARDVAAVWRWARTAAREALARGAPYEGAVHLERALEVASAIRPDPFEHAAVAESLGDAWELVGRPAPAHDAYRTARRVLSDDPVRRARICRKQARVDQRAGRFRSALSWSTRGLKLLGDRDDAVAAELYLVAGVVRFFQGRFDDAIELATAAAETAQRAGDPASLAQAHLQLEMAYSELGRKDERAHHAERALRLLEELDDRLGLANLHLNLGVSRYNEADWSAALAHYERSSDHFRVVGDTIGAEAARNNQAEILTDQGRLEEAGTILEEVERALRAAQHPLGIAITTSGRARVALRTGDPERAGDLLDAARSAFVDLDARHMVLDTDVRRVEHMVWIGDSAAADRLAGRIEHELSAGGPVAVLPATLARLRGWAAVRDGDRAGAERRFRHALALAAAEAFEYEVALALDALHVTGCGTVTDEERGRLAALVRDLGVVETPVPAWFERR